MPPETFFGLTAMQVQGWAAIASVALTAVLVLTTMRYVKLTNTIASAASHSYQHEVDKARRERDRERGMVGMAIGSIVADLGTIELRNLENEAVKGLLPQRVLGLGLPDETLIAHAQGISADVFFKVGTVLRNIKEADAGLKRLNDAAGPRAHSQLSELSEIAEKIKACCRVALKHAQDCQALIARAAEDR